MDNNNARCGSQVVVLTVGHIGGARGIFRQENLYLGRAGSVIHLGCCHTPGAAGAGTKFFDNAS